MSYKYNGILNAIFNMVLNLRCEYEYYSTFTENIINLKLLLESEYFTENEKNKSTCNLLFKRYMNWNFKGNNL